MKLILALTTAALLMPATTLAAEKNPIACKQLRADLRNVQEAQRRKSTSYLNDRERSIRKKMAELSCNRMD